MFEMQLVIKLAGTTNFSTLTLQLVAWKVYFCTWLTPLPVSEFVKSLG